MYSLSTFQKSDVFSSDHAAYWESWIIESGGTVDLPQRNYLIAKSNRQELLTFQLSSNGKFLAGCNLLLRKFGTYSRPITSYLVSNVIVHKESRGLGVLRNLMAEVVSFLDQKEAMGFIVARRAVDGMYDKLGFEAFATFTTYKFKGEGKKTSIPIRIQKKEELSLEELIAVNRLYDSNYSNIFPYFIRENCEWTQIMQKNNSGNISLYLVEAGTRTAGYFVVANSKVVEVALDLGNELFSLEEITSHVMMQASNFPIKIQSTHPMLFTNQRNFSSTENRKVLQGGHLWRVPNALLKMKQEMFSDNQESFISVLDEF